MDRITSVFAFRPETNQCPSSLTFSLPLPITVPNLKSLRLPPPPHPPLHEHMKGFLPKCTVLKVDLLQDHQIYCWQAPVCVNFSARIFYRLGQLRG